MADTRVRRWLFQALAEAAFVVFAVLVALAVDEWWEDRERAELAVRTTEAIAGEIRRNRDQLISNRTGADPAALVAALDSAIAAYRDDRPPGDVSVNWNVVLLSSAAWEIARLNEITRTMDLDRVMRLAELYELQGFFARNQDALASMISDVGARMETEPVMALSQVRSRLRLTASLGQTLTTVYACALERLEGPGAVEPDACPEGGN
jgi:hypothetical protein